MRAARTPQCHRRSSASLSGTAEKPFSVEYGGEIVRRRKYAGCRVRRRRSKTERVRVGTRVRVVYGPSFAGSDSNRSKEGGRGGWEGRRRGGERSGAEGRQCDSQSLKCSVIIGQMGSRMTRQDIVVTRQGIVTDGAVTAIGTRTGQPSLIGRWWCKSIGGSKISTLILTVVGHVTGHTGSSTKITYYFRKSVAQELRIQLWPIFLSNYGP